MPRKARIWGSAIITPSSPQDVLQGIYDPFLPVCGTNPMSGLVNIMFACL